MDVNDLAQLDWKTAAVLAAGAVGIAATAGVTLVVFSQQPGGMALLATLATRAR